MKNKMEIYLLGTSHKTAEVEFREKLAFPCDALPAVLKDLKAAEGISEGLILSTCNRTEILAVAPSSQSVFNAMLGFLSEASRIPLENKQNYFYRKIGEDAIKHLFRVAAGLDSMVLGEPQILGQVKNAFRVAAEESTTGVILNRLLNHSFVVGKRVRTETALGTGAVSVAYAAVELAQKIFRDLSAQSALLIGAGETGELTALHLREKGIGKMYIANRTHEKAVELARKLEGEAVEFSRMAEIFPLANIIIGAASAPQYLVRPRDLEGVLHKRRGHPLFMVDIGVPRDFDPEINKLESVFLHDIDDLQQIIDRNLEKRHQEIPKAYAIISDEIQNFLEWKKNLQVTPTIVSLREKMEQIRQAELSKQRHKMSDSEFEKADLISRAVMNKFLHNPMVQLKKYGNGRVDGLKRIDVVRELFNLEDEE
jgi:glutamyl-tRNA reductase